MKGLLRVVLAGLCIGLVSGGGGVALPDFPRPAIPNPAIVLAGTPVAGCRDLSNVDRPIAACTTVNASKNLAKRTRAIALSNRCSAYQHKGMPEKAILNCTRAIAHDRTNRDAYYNPARALR